MLQRFGTLLKKLSPQQMILLYYFIAFFVASLLLSLPFLTHDEIDLAVIDTVFMAASALSVTGLSTISIIDTYNVYGFIILMFIMNLGGIGIMAMGTLIYLLFKKKIGYKERIQIMVENNQYKVSGSVKLVLDIVSVIIFIEAIGAIYYVLFFLNQGYSVQSALLHGIFLSISATTNGGLDIHGNSLIQYNRNYILQVIVMIQIVLGAIGFPVLLEIKGWITARMKNEKFRFSLFTKLATSTYIILFVIGAVLIFAMEFRNYFRFDNFFNTLMNSIFSSVSSRSGGLITVDPGELTDGTQLVMSGLMFIGSSPSSAGGGIRTTTFAVLVLFLLAFSRGREEVSIFNRQLERVDIDRAIAVIMLALLLVFMGITAISLIENNRFDLILVIFEVTSAFGTAGASTGITPELHPISKIILIIFMFIGRIGFVSFLFSISGKQTNLNHQYTKERILIG